MKGKYSQEDLSVIERTEGLGAMSRMFSFGCFQEEVLATLSP